MSVLYGPRVITSRRGIGSQGIGRNRDKRQEETSYGLRVKSEKFEVTKVMVVKGLILSFDI